VQALRDSTRQQRNALLSKLDPATVQKAWFTLSHMLLDDGAHILDMGCESGEMSYAMALLAPNMTFTAIDKNKRQINRAKERFQRDNLTFVAADAGIPDFAPESVDAIINSYILHEVYSSCRYNTQTVTRTLETQFKALKKGGLLFIRDFSRPPPNEMVLMEIPDKPSTGNDLKGMSDADLLVWYSAHARPKQDPGCGGFFLEELPARIPQTRLFHLPYKWAYEFVMRKDRRKEWENELPMEYTFFTVREFRKTLSDLGARVEYSAPYWEDDIVEKRFIGKFRLYQEDFKPLGYPPTCFMAVARKLAERKSLSIEERRPSLRADQESTLQIRTMRNEKNGELQEVVARNYSVSEILPYRLDENNRLKIYLHEGIPRAIINSVPRKGINVDNKRWSSHMIEAITVDTQAFSDIEEFDHKHSALFARDYLGLKPQSSATMITGPSYYPSPDYIDEKIQTYYLPVEQSRRKVIPTRILGYADKFQAKGQIREFDAQQVLDAIAVGMIPNSRLELQLLSLFQHLGLRAETWTSKDITNHIIKATTIKKDVRNFARMLNEPDKRFREVKGRIGQLRNIHSVFVEEGKAQGSISGLSSQDLDFVVTDDQTINIAVVIPLTKNMKEEVHAGALVKHLPVPQRYEGNGLTFTAPAFPLPDHIRTSAEIKRFLAEKFAISPECVTKLGESYFTHTGLTQQRIHPYAIAAPPPANYIDDPYSVFVPIKQMRALWKNIKMDSHLMTVLARAWKYLPSVMKLDAKAEAKAIAKTEMQGDEPDWIVPESFDLAPILEEPEAAPELTLDKKIDKLQQVVEAKVLPKEEEQEIVAKIKDFKIDKDKYKPGANTASLSREFESEIDDLLEKLDNHPALDIGLP